MRNKDIKKVLVIGSGPIIIGQAAEFDYAGTQCCKTLKEEGIEAVLVNSNPATLMTSGEMAKSIYIEALNEEVLERIIEKEAPDSIISTLGGQTALNLSMRLAKSGFLNSHNVRLLGANASTIDKAEDRQLFKDTMISIGEPVIPSLVVHNTTDALHFVEEVIGYPAIVRPAFTLGGTGGGIAESRDALIEICENGLHRSPIKEVLIEKCIAGYKEIEFEVIRDSKGNAITVCAMENVDAVGVHTGDSIVTAPTLTLSDKEYQMLRTSALKIINTLGIEGGCNCQFALNPYSFEYAVIEVNPRVSRSSALASKATGYPIARVATLIALGYTLDEITNTVTGATTAAYEPALDYVVVKMPRFPFDKFVYAKRELGTQMKATGEVMAIGITFTEALLKAVRGLEIGTTTLNFSSLKKEEDADIMAGVSAITDLRIFYIYEALKRGLASVEEISRITKITPYFISCLLPLISMEKRLTAIKKEGKKDANAFPLELYKSAKRLGYLDSDIKSFAGFCPYSLPPNYRMVDTCAGEFMAKTPYFYSSYEEGNEALSFITRSDKDFDKNNKNNKGNKGTILVLGSGPIRIGQGIEFDYACVECVWELKRLGYDVAIVNNNPETVSTDFDTADRLYFEPLTLEDVLGVIQTEHPLGVVVAFGGGTAIKLTQALAKKGINILGTSAEGIDIAEDRARFDALCERLKIKRPKGVTVFTTEEALEAVHKTLGYPVLLRPSYVLGGQNMIIAFSDDDIKEYMAIILSHNIKNPVLVDQYLMGTELEVDCLCDGHDVLLPGIMEHIERTGIHSGDSIAVYPSWNLNDVMREKIIDQSTTISLALGTKGLVNIQYLIYNNDLYIIEVNPRASRTVPYISKVSGVPIVTLASHIMTGKRLKDLGYGTGLYRVPPYFAVKVPVFSFEKLTDVDTHLGPEMKSTGEVLGIASTMEEALYKGLIAAGYNMKKGGGVLFSVRATDKYELPDLARRFSNLGFTLYATEGNQKVLNDFGINAIRAFKIREREDNILTLLDSGKIDYVLSTSAKGRSPQKDSVRLRRHTVDRDIPCLTSLDTANALAGALESFYSTRNIELININALRMHKETVRFTKMESTGNTFLIIDCRQRKLDNPEGTATRLCNYKKGIGADSLVLIFNPKNPEAATARMQFYNQDGTEGLMAGNAIRAVAKYLYDNDINATRSRQFLPSTVKDSCTTARLTIETASGNKSVTIYTLNGEVSSACVDMGQPVFSAKEIPTLLKEDKTNTVLNAPLVVDGKEYQVTSLSMGNPHCVVFCDFVDKVDLLKIGPLFEHNASFPERVNTEFVRVVSRNELKVRTWERGNGETAACGTGAAAAAIAAILNGFCPKQENITVNMVGGKLLVKWDTSVYLTGNTKTLYTGEIQI